MLSFLHEASWSGDRTLLICDETRRTALIQRLDNKGFGAGNSDLRIRLTMRSWQELYQSDQTPGPTAFPGLIDAALIESRASSVPVASVWSDILLPAVQAADTQVMADYARRLSDLVVQHNCNLVCAYELTGWDAPALLKVMSVHPMVLAGSHIQSNPFFEQPARWLSRPESAAELPSSNRDVAALSMLSTTWCNRDPPGIAGDLATALASIVNAEFIATTSLGDGREGYRLAWTRSAAWAASDVIDAVRAVAPGHLEDSFAGVMAEIANLADLRTCRVLFVPMGLGANALLVIGSVDPRFPTASQRTLIGLSVSLLSISIQRWRAETEEHRFTILVGNSKDFIGIASLDGTPQYVNSAGLQLVGLNDVEQCRQLTILDFLPESDRIRVRDECWRIVTETGRWCGELRLRNFKTGAIIPVLVDWFRIDDKRTGKAAVMATVSRDLTAQKQAEAELRSLNNRLEQQIRTRTIALSDANVDLQRAEELRRHADARLQELQAELFHAGRLSAMGQMAGALAHELGQPLGAIANYINAARRFLTEGRDHELELARTNMDHAAEVVLRAGRIIRAFARVRCRRPAGATPGEHRGFD